MKIIKPNVICTTVLNNDKIYSFIEKCGRTCYKSAPSNKISSEEFIRRLIKSGHESVLEHYSVSFIIICDRGVSHELVRHRLASYSQESTRYCNYNGKDIEFIKPTELNESSISYILWHDLCEKSEIAYKNLIKSGIKPETARSVLPNSLKTEIVMTANLREWRHFLKLRCIGTTGKPHPDMKIIAEQILAIFKENIPVIVEDIVLPQESRKEETDTEKKDKYYSLNVDPDKTYFIWRGEGEEIFEVMSKCFKEVFNADDNSLHK